MAGYAELHCLSNFTFLRGASRAEELVARAHALGYAALAITDECSVAGVVRAHAALRELAGSCTAVTLRLIVGSELWLSDGLRLVVLAANRRGYGQLCRLITRGRRAAPKGEYCLGRADVAELLRPGDCLLLWLDADAAVAGPAGQRDAAQCAAADHIAAWLRAHFDGAAWIAVELLREGRDRARLAALTALGARTGLSLVAAGDVHMHARERRRLQDALTAIRHNVPVAEAGPWLLASGERHLRPRERLAKIYPPALLAETLAVAARCTFSLDELRYEYPREIVPDGHTPTSWLRELTEQGAALRWPRGLPARARELIEHELTLIADLGYEPYFLTVQDVVAFARSQDILCQGRGSAANSAVCYCLGITEVDPARMSMLVERFISRERNEPPDIDIDFEHERREEVIQYVYRKYGRERAALAATVICYRPRSTLRDLGKALGLDPAQTEKLAGAIHWWSDRIDPEHVRESGFDPDNPQIALLLSLARELLGFPRHLSQHVGGFVIARDLLEELVPVENAAMPDRTVIQWDKDDLDDLGLIKVDILGLGMLTAIRRALALVTGVRGRPFTMMDVPAEDAVVYEMISRADTVGVFQIESRAQMSMLPRLRPRNYYDLVIEVAIIRPGPIQGGMVHPYLRRRNGEEVVTYPSPAVEGVLRRTLGVPIFQEQVMQLAVVAAGFTPGEADQLRRAMAAWKRRGGLGHFEQKLIDGMRERGYQEQFARQIFQQIQGFGEYGFPECVVGETRVVDARTGRYVTVEDAFRRRVPLERTLACDPCWRLSVRRVQAIVESGVKPVWRLRTALGHEITATAEHPFRMLSGWRKLGELKPGDRIAVARRYPGVGRRRWPRHQIIVLAGLVAEGNLCHPNTFYFHTTDTAHRDEFVAAVERFPNTRAVIEQHRDCHSVRVRRIDRRLPPGAVTWVRELGPWGRGARDKHLPAVVFELCRSHMSMLLARLWDGDGGASRSGHVSYDTASAQLATDVQHLLRRLGIVARRYTRRRQYRGQALTHYCVTVTGTDMIRAFWRQIGHRMLESGKRDIIRSLANSSTGRMSLDIVPVEVRQLVRRERDARGWSWTKIGHRSGLGMREVQAARESAKGGFRRFVIGRLGQVLGSQPLSDLATSDIYWDRIVSIEAAGHRPTYDLQIEGDHNFLANDFVVHNSHAASFALLVYVSCWLKCHEPAAFTAALLNSQPMGFYAPAQLVRDARNHGVEVRPVDVCVSAVDCTLEPAAALPAPGQPALRLGLGMVRSLSAEGAARVVAARAAAPFADVQDLARRAVLDRGDLEALAAAGALAALTGNRHLAFWGVAGAERELPLAPRSERGEALPLLPVPTEGEDIVADYRAVGLSLGRHPLALLREQFATRRVLTAAALAAVPHGRVVTVAGLVLTRQRPASASGVTFVTLEDETGQVNLVVWERTGLAQRRALVESRLMEVRGELQREGQVTHVIAHRMTDRSALLAGLLAGLRTESRDFH
jgi:DNA-directed DNA polymerase III PolC